MSADRKKLPLVYSCSGCSSAAQMANYVAVQLDRRGAAEMSCIAGVGGDVPSLLKVARSGRPIIVIDGCPLVCAQKSLERHGIAPVEHVQLAECGVKKRFHTDFDLDVAERIIDQVTEAADALKADGTGTRSDRDGIAAPTSLPTSTQRPG